MNALTYTLRLAEPLLATQPHSGEANSATAYDYIPGSMIRGALVRAYRRNHPEAADLPRHDEGNRLFLGGPTRFLNAYPVEPRDGRRMLPRPLSWFVEKEQVKSAAGSVFDSAVEANAALKRPKPPSGPFCHTDDAGSVRHVYLYAPGRQVTVHNASDDRDRKQQGSSQVFRYDALAAGQVFSGVILSDNADDLKTIAELLKKGLFALGGAGTGGYGRVEMMAADDVVSNWREYPAEAVAPDGTLVVTLLSDAILPANGTLLPDTLAALFGAPGVTAAFQDVRLVGGFNRTWGMPLPQAWALAAGSVFVLPQVDAARAARLLDEGLGERRIDGFGRVALNWQTHPTLERIPYRSIRMEPAKPGPAGRALAQRMADRLLRRQLETKLTEEIHNRGPRLKELPSATQLSRVRLAARRAALAGDVKPILEHLRAMRPLTRKEWEKARVGKDRLLPWISGLCQLDEAGFRRLFDVAEDAIQVAGVSATASDELRMEYVARLIDGVMKQGVEMQKKSRRGGQ